METQREGLEAVEQSQPQVLVDALEDPDLVVRETQEDRNQGNRDAEAEPHDSAQGDLAFGRAVAFGERKDFGIQA